MHPCTTAHAGLRRAGRCGLPTSWSALYDHLAAMPLPPRPCSSSAAASSAAHNLQHRGVSCAASSGGSGRPAQPQPQPPHAAPRLPPPQLSGPGALAQSTWAHGQPQGLATQGRGRRPNGPNAPQSSALAISRPVAGTLGSLGRERAAPASVAPPRLKVAVDVDEGTQGRRLLECALYWACTGLRRRGDGSVCGYPQPLAQAGRGAGGPSSARSHSRRHASGVAVLGHHLAPLLMPTAHTALLPRSSHVPASCSCVSTAHSRHTHTRHADVAHACAPTRTIVRPARPRCCCCCSAWAFRVHFEPVLQGPVRNGVRRLGLLGL